jgi:hypothetical protein
MSAHFAEQFLNMSSPTQMGVLLGIAVVLVVIVPLLSPSRTRLRSNMSKSQRAKEMKQAFHLLEKQHRPSNGTASMKVSDHYIQMMCYSLTKKMKAIQDRGEPTMEISQVVAPSSWQLKI